MTCLLRSASATSAHLDLGEDARDAASRVLHAVYGFEHRGPVPASWLQRYTPDIALVMLGTNDPGDEPDPEHPERGMAVEAGELIDLLRANNPRVIIVFAPPFHEWSPFPSFRAEMERPRAGINFQFG